MKGIRIGYEAARHLHELMRDRRKASREPVRVPVKRAMVRASTEAVACEDPTVRRALMFIRSNYASNLSMMDVVREAAVCRRTLELRFRKHLGRSILEEIRAFRLRHALYLLEDTDLPVGTIYRRCGYMTHQVFYSVFKALHGVTPQQYRERHGKVFRVDI